MRHIHILAAALAATGAAAAGVAMAQTRGLPWATPPRVEARDGEGVYRAVCQGCHMPDGQGAVGAAAYPALANNPRLEAAAYPVTLILQGQRAMPAVGTLMDDAQIAAVVTYIRTHWGNDYREPVTEQDVRAAR